MINELIDSQIAELTGELGAFINLKLIFYWMAGFVGMGMNWFKMWVNNEITCSMYVWFTDNKKSTIYSVMTFMASGFALIGLDGFDKMTY